MEKETRQSFKWAEKGMLWQMDRGLDPLPCTRADESCRASPLGKREVRTILKTAQEALKVDGYERVPITDAQAVVISGDDWEVIPK